MTITLEPMTRERAAKPPSPRATFAALTRRGLRDHRRAPLVWGGSLGLFSALIALVYPSIEDSLHEMVEGYPDGLKEAFGVGEIDTAAAYVHAEMFSLIIPLALGFFAIRCIARATVAAEEKGYLDLLLATPVSRRLLVAGSFAVAAASTALVLVVVAALTWIGGVVSGADLPLSSVAAGAASVWPLSLFAAGVGLVAAGCLHRDATVTGTASAVLVGMYLIDVLGKLAEPVEPLRAISAFKYYGAAMQDGLDVGGAFVLIAAAFALSVLGGKLFAGRDIVH